MSDIIPNVVVSMPSQLFTLRRKFAAVSNGKVYIGKIDMDPTIPDNQIQVYIENEDGSHVPVAQPIIINQAGFPVYNGQISKFVTVEGHSMALYDAYGAQQFYFPNILKYNPDRFKEQAEKYIQYIEKLKGTIKQTTGDSTTDVISQKACDDNYAKKDSWEKFTAGQINIMSNGNYTSLTRIKGDGNKLLLETAPGDAYFVYRDAKNKNKAVVTIPSNKNGALAIQEDNYTKTEVDAKISSVKWIANKSANGWLKDPNTGMVIQWGSVPRNDSSRKLFPMAFPNTLAGMGLANFNSNSNLSQMYAPNIMSADRVGFNMRQSKVTEGSNASPFTDMRWIAIGW
ncbi:Head binding protein [Arsenophonus nasoniae]|uniref:Head binding protein n=1 Tax=Arsenophonus nasoniae TaxID=638 RepID=A0A4P7KRB7_9GAMM|nr:Head binding protein [Arsenophonus nasoniae]